MGGGGAGSWQDRRQVSGGDEAHSGGYSGEASAVQPGPASPFSGPLSPRLRGGGHFLGPWPQAQKSPACVLVPGPSAFFTPHSLCRLQAPLLPGSHVCTEQSPAPNTGSPLHALQYRGASMGCTLHSGWPGSGGDRPGVGGRERGHLTTAGSGQGCALARSLPRAGPQLPEGLPKWEQ